LLPILDRVGGGPIQVRPAFLHRAGEWGALGKKKP